MKKISSFFFLSSRINLKCYFREKKENFAKSFIVIAEFYYIGTLKIRKVEKQRVKLTLVTIRNVLTIVFKNVL